MDRTELFKATVKTVRTRLRAQQREEYSTGDSVFSKGRKPSKFASHSKTVVQSITSLKLFLQEHKKDYIDPSGYLASEFARMTEEDRDRVEQEAQEIISMCSEQIAGLQDNLNGDLGEGENEQVRQCRKEIVQSLQDYLKAVCKMYSEQKAVRVKRVIDRKRTSRLQPEGMRRPLSPQYSLGSRGLEPDSSNKSQSAKDLEMTDLPARTEQGSGQAPFPFQDDVPDFSPEEAAIFQQENELLFDHMSTLVDEVRQIEGKVVEISHLQEIFSEKVLQQSYQLDGIQLMTVTSTDNVKEGNEKIREAIRNKGSLRRWILFILIVCSFSLIFLDWYS